MKKSPISVLFTLIIITSFFVCVTNKKIAPYENNDNNNNNEITDVTTMATPEGGKLKSAQEGPIRSALGVPIIDLNTFKLEITGLVDYPYTLTWNEIQTFPAAYTDTILMYCVEGWEVWGNWKGILVKDLMDKARMQPEAKYIYFSCADSYSTALPVSYALKYNAMLAYEVNGSPLKEQDGFPLRLIAFGKYGYKWAKWVTKLEAVEKSRKGFWEMRGYSDQADVPLKRRRYYEGENAQSLDY